MLVLEGAQAGLSWRTILRKRSGYRAAFDGFDAARVARYDAARQARLARNPGIVRNRAKIAAAVANARATVALRESGRTLDAYLWDFVDGAPIVNRWRRTAEVPAETPLSAALSKDLKAQGFRFVGPVVVYAFMQAVGMVNDHVVSCFRHAELAARRGSTAPRPSGGR